MPYYPLSQIKPNLYTNGGEYVLSTTRENYIGYYYQTSNGKRYTGKTPQDGSNIYLLKINPNLNDFPETRDIGVGPLSFVYYNSVLTYPKTLSNGQIEQVPYPSNNTNNFAYSKTNPLQPRTQPIPNITLPTQKDYTLGTFQRFFCKKNNENTYFEIDQNTYNLLKSQATSIAWDLYNAVYTMWSLTGNKTTVAQSNKGLIENIERTQKWYGFSQYFKNDFTQYHKFLDISNLYTSGSEFKTKNGQEYIGFYHIHNGNIPMVGKTHITEFHETLIPISQSLSLTPINQTSSMSPTTISPTLISGGSFGGGGSSGGGGGY
jgi:uncharacterized membrane protein YgcG